MKVYKVFIDGQAGTTGLRLADRLGTRDDIKLIPIEDAFRKDTKTRLSCIAEADVVFLCLPDKDAAEIVVATEQAGLKNTRIIDCSTEHRTAVDWKYGIPELFSIGTEDVRVANPGCHATGYIMSVRPLVEAGIVDKDASLSFHSLTGYSGGGKPMIAEYENERRSNDEGSSLKAPRQYALQQSHKHLPEVHKYAGLNEAPIFSPIVCDYYSGMLVSVAIPHKVLKKGGSAEIIRDELSRFYEDQPLVKIRPEGAEFLEISGGGFLSADAFKDRDDIEIFICGNDDRIDIVSRYDNLGKGASGAAIQNMNLILGLQEDKGLILGD